MNSPFLLVVLATSITARCYCQNGIDFVVPLGSSNLDGNSFSCAGPAANQPQTIRYQQVYGASEFATLTNFGGGWLVSIHFRGDATNGTQLGLKMPSVQVNLSTTQRGPDELGPVFSENVGADDAAVHSGSLETVLIGGHQQGTETFAFEILLFTKPFFYNPAAGNLLLDVRVFQGNTNSSGTIQPVFDAVNFTNDSIARVWSTDVNASTGLVETVGLVTDFNVWRNPKLSVQSQGNSIVFTWPANPPWISLPETVLQTKHDIAGSAEWQSITNGIVQGFLVNTFTIPLISAGKEAYFRLVSTAPP